MIDGNQLREEFGRYLAEHKATRWGMDAALMHVCKIAYDAGKADGRDAAPLVQNGEVLVTVTGLTGSGKSAIAGEIEIMCRALGLDAEFVGGASEKHLTHAYWTESLEMYRPRVRIIERNIPRTDAAPAPSRTAPAPAEVPMPEPDYRGPAEAGRDAEIEALRLYVRALCKAVDAATDFAGTVAGGASWWDDVWAAHAAALDRARERISQAALRGEVKP